MQHRLRRPHAPSPSVYNTRCCQTTIKTTNHDQKHFRRNSTQVQNDAPRGKVYVETFLWLLDQHRPQSREKNMCCSCRFHISRTQEISRAKTCDGKASIVRSILSPFATCRYTSTAPLLKDSVDTKLLCMRLGTANPFTQFQERLGKKQTT